MATIKELLDEKDLGVLFNRDQDLFVFAEMLESAGLHLLRDGGAISSAASWPIRGIPDDNNENRTLVCGCGNKENIIPFEEFCALVQDDEEEIPDNGGMEDLI